MRTALPALTTALIIAAVRLHRTAVTRARTAGYLTAVRDVRCGLLTLSTRVDAPEGRKEYQP